MRYMDTGSRNPNDAVGGWLEAVVGGGDISELRVQVGYVGPQPLGYLEPVLQDLAANNGKTTILIGSNNGETSREMVDGLIRLAGPPRLGLRLGVVSFADGLFHPKVYHVVRNDGSMAAYVGSANFTFAGVSGKNVEAGIALDTREGDSPSALIDIIGAIDDWFSGSRDGLFPVSHESDVAQLVIEGALSASCYSSETTTASVGERATGVLRTLAALLRLPAISSLSVPVVPMPAAPPNTTFASPRVPAFVDDWSKPIRASDAQRKPGGNQSGVIVLTQGNRRGQIDQTTFFRDDFFGGLVWEQVETRTNNVKDIAPVPMHVSVLGNYLGMRVFEVTHDNVREADQNNYTATLSVSAIRDEFARTDMSGHTLTIGRDAAGEFWFDIS